MASRQVFSPAVTGASGKPVDVTVDGFKDPRARRRAAA